jgi:hypothetical protein
MISTGFLLKWILPVGSGRIEMSGIGRHGKAIYTVLGLDRHDWGQIHFYISLSLIGLLMIHLILHRKWILMTAWGTKDNPQSLTRRFITLGILIFILATLALPWILPKTILG